MTKKLLTKHCALMLLVAFAAAWSTTAWADVTINVKAPSAPHMYVWNSSQTPLNGEWPGEIVTNTKVVNGETYYTKTFDENTVGVIFAKDENTQTGDFSGLTGEVFFHYDGETLAYGDLPDNAIYEPTGKFVYFVNSKNWATVNCHVYNGNSTSTEAMTYIGNDKAGQKVYKWGPNNNLSFNPTDIIFNNGNWQDQGGVQTPSHSFTNGGYYVYSETNNGNNKRLDLVATIDASRITNTDTYFADPHFREALTKSIGVAAGAAFTPADYTILDLSYDSDAMTGKISNLSGISHFTNLEELNISNNSIAYGDITSLTSLKKIVAAGNSELQGFGVGTPSSNNKILKISTSSVLEYVDVSNCDTYYLTALNNNCGSTLKTLIAANNSRFDYGDFTQCSVLEYLDFSNCGLISDALKEARFKGAGGANLKYLDVSNNASLYNVYVKDKTGLETIIMKNCTAYDYGSFEYCTNLKHADFSGCTALASEMWDHLKPDVHTQLQYLNLSNGTTNISGHTFSFPALDTLIINNHNTITSIKIDSHCPSIIDITNDTQLANLAITNCGLTSMPNVSDLSTATALTKIDLTGNAFSAVPSIGGNVNTMVMNSNQLTDIVVPSNINYLYAQNNNFQAGDYTLPTNSLVGLDLGNNGFTKFKAENNASLKSLVLAPNANLTEIELHGNTALTQTSPDGVIESDNGLYIKGLSNLQTLNIENSSFNKLGQQRSLQGLNSLVTLQARKNKFTTFTNGVNALDQSGHVNYRIPDSNESTLEDLPELKYLDLAYNNLRDSVHLYKNVNLEHLDVSHNVVITGVKDGTITTTAQKQAMIEKKGRRLMKYNKKYTAAGVNVSEADWKTEYTDYQSLLERPFDLRECDLNDTIGIYHLDLQKNTKLKWLDFSYTGIRNTALGPEHMNPGWMDEDWVTDDDLSAHNSGNTSSQRVYSSWHSFIYVKQCPNLEVIHADHNNMQSIGFSYFPYLDTLTVSYMYGDCAYMRDYGAMASPPKDITVEDNGYGQGNTGMSGKIRKFKSISWKEDGSSVIALQGPDGTSGDNDYYPNKIRYYDFSNSGFNEIRLNNGAYLEYADVSGNPLGYNIPTHDSSKSYYNSLDLTYCPNIRTVKADNCSDLPIVRAHNRPVLDTLYLSNDPNLKALYVQNDPLLKTNFVGLSTLTGLETLFGYNNTHWGNDITFSSNTALKNLWISNIGATTLDVTDNTALEKLRAYDNGLTNLYLSENENLKWLDVARNKLPNIDLSDNTMLEFFNISNGIDTRTQLDGTERLNHDGSDGDAIYPTTVYSDDDAPVASADAGNSLSDLVLPASIIDARANGNDLHSITGSFANLTNIEFAHNHINGISLPSGVTVDSRDNGRTILADCSKFIPHGDFGNEVTVYFFQIDPNETGNGTVLTDRDSKDIKNKTRYLGDDGLDLGKITGWTSDAAVLTANAGGKNVTLNPDNMGQYLDPSQVPGTIVVLAEDPNNPGEGKAQYSYSCSNNTNNRDNNATFYLNWSSDGTVTGINSVIGDDGFDLAGTYGGIVVAGKDGTVVGVYDTNGRQIASETISGGKLTIDGLSPGIYIVNGNKVLVK